MNECEVTKVNLPKFPTPQLIVLTVEEAKLALESAYISAHIYRGDNGEGAIKAFELCKALQKRIEQAEKP